MTVVSATPAVLKEVVSPWGVYHKLPMPSRNKAISVALGIEDEVFCAYYWQDS